MSNSISTMKARAEGALLDPATTLADCKTAADTLKTLTDYEKASADVNAQRKLLRYEAMKSFSTGVVPLLTLATLAITVYFQYSQAQITDRANEDNRWKTVVESMARPPGETSDLVSLTGLTPFYDSARYGAQAYDMAFLMANRLSSLIAFQTLFRAAFVHAGWNNLESMVRLNDMLRSNFDRLNGLFDKVGGQAAINKRREKNVPAKTAAPDDLEKISAARDEVLSSQTFLANEVGNLLREKRPSGWSSASLAGFYFFEADLSNANLSGLDLGGAKFERVELEGAILTPKNIESSSWNGSRWWKASKIDGISLKYLIKNAGPYTKKGEIFPVDASGSDRVERAEYVKALEKLCGDAGIKCDPEREPFGSPEQAARDP
jgi:hypothetical protein